jgi:arylsulfatase A-like enzyme
MKILVRREKNRRASGRGTAAREAGLLLGCLLLGCLWLSLPTGAAPRRPPNIVIIMADDLGFSDIGCYGSEIETPHLDRLAAGGLRFTQFYNTGRCCPSRAALLTGLYPHQAGVGHMVEANLGPPASYQNDLNDSSVTIAEALRPAGYQSCAVGKWHVTPYPNASKHNYPLQRGFDRFYGTLSGLSNVIRDNSVTETKPGDEGFNYTDAITEEAVRYLTDAAQADRPFFLYVAYTAPHYPLWAEAEDIARYRGRYLGGWEAVREARYRRLREAGIIGGKWALSPSDAAAPAWAEVGGREAWDLKMAIYAAQVARLDRGVGRILARLAEAGLDRRTLVLFLSDNGAEAAAVNRTPGVAPGGKNSFASYGLPWANVSNTPFRLYKSQAHEGGIATPLIAYWPGVTQPGRITHQPGHIIDLMATCLDVAGVRYPRTYRGRRVTPLEGKSLMPVLRGQRRAGHKALFWEHEGNRAVRQGRWKLVARFNGAWELYDLEADRTELTDLAAKLPRKVRELAAQYEAWARRVGVVPWGQLARKRRGRT